MIDHDDNPVGYAHTTLFRVFLASRRRRSSHERPSPALPEPPAVVYVSGSEDARVAVAAMKAGAADYVVKTVGEDHAAIGSDFDGAIAPPRDLKSVLELPRLVELMLRRGFRTDTIRKILGQNALRMLAALRP